jgi:hypothetical protein
VAANELGGESCSIPQTTNVSDDDGHSNVPNQPNAPDANTHGRRNDACAAIQQRQSVPGKLCCAAVQNVAEGRCQAWVIPFSFSLQVATLKHAVPQESGEDIDTV